MPDKTSRPLFDEYIMSVCHVVASRATCRHRGQGAVIVHNNRIISTGYNGAPPGALDCLELGFCSKNDRNLPCLAEGLHGESNAILTAAREGISVEGSTLYCVYSPCRACCNMIKVAGIREVVFERVYEDFVNVFSYLYALYIKARVVRSQND